MDLYDCHTHSTFSFDGKAGLEEQCQAAWDKGMKGICFTEHFSVDERDVSYGVMDYPAYHQEIDKMREKFAGRIFIGRGLEIGEPHLPACREKLAAALQDMQLDFIIGSIHNIDGVKLRNYMSGKSKDELYGAYFQEILTMAETADIDVIGHLDLVKLYGAIGGYGHYEFEKYRTVLTRILRTAVERGIGLEINTAGWRKEAGEQYPMAEVLDLYKELGGEIVTLGSDGHKTADIGAGFAQAVELLKETGYTNYYYFTARQQKKIAI